MENDPFGFNTASDSPTDHVYNPHIDPSLQASIATPYAQAALEQAQHDIPFYPPHAQTSSTPYQNIRNSLSVSRHDVQQLQTPTSSRSKNTPSTPYNTNGGHFGVLKLSYVDSPLQNGTETQVQGQKKEHLHFQGMKKVPNPPNLDEWRDRLFNVNEIIYLTEDEFQTYFPHVDNVYSHRSTQNYKRKPFVTSYWDCRLKGRPPGTPKSTDPNKKKRKRVARERDLCDVKIKITEYFPGARAILNPGSDAAEQINNDSFFNDDGAFDSAAQQQAFADMMNGVTPNTSVQANSLPGADGKRYYSIQRVNGTSDNDNAGGLHTGHKHDLAESDRIKKNSIIRGHIKDQKDSKKEKKTYSRKATGPAAATVKRHNMEHEFKFYAVSSCPFTQRVWIALEAKGMNYQYIEIDPLSKPAALMDVSQGLYPAILHGALPVYDIKLILDYVEDIDSTILLRPAIPAQRAYVGHWIGHIEKHIVPNFYQLLQAQDTATQLAKKAELQDAVDKLVKASDPAGPFFSGPDLSMVDVYAAPHLLRFSRILTPYRGWPAPSDPRLRVWLDALEEHPAVKATISGDEVYHDSYQRFAERLSTGQFPEVINEGQDLP